MLDVKLTDQPDGSAIAELQFLDRKTLLAFASIGFLKVLEDEANRVIAEDATLKKELKKTKKKRK